MNKEVNILQLSYGNYVSLNDYVKLQQENQQLKKQKDDVVEYVNSIVFEGSFTFVRERAEVKYNILRMLGEKDEL